MRVYYKKGGSLKKNKRNSSVNEAGNYTKPSLRKRIFNRIKAGGKVKGYKGGGNVRGCGMARKGTRPVKMVVMKGSG